MRMIDLTNTTSGRWTIISRAENTAQGQAQWFCRCECGSERTLKSIVIRKGLSTSCGCRKLEILVERSTKHGHATNGISPTYHSWVGMIARCTNPKHKAHERYGGRGITVDPRWMKFENFLADMGEKPPGLSIDRVDYEAGYCKDNCRWATASQQARNKTSNTVMTLGTRSMTIAEWCDELGVKPSSMSYRVCSGWTDERALTTPFKRVG